MDKWHRFEPPLYLVGSECVVRELKSSQCGEAALATKGPIEGGGWMEGIDIATAKVRSEAMMQDEGIHENVKSARVEAHP